MGILDNTTLVVQSNPASWATFAQGLAQVKGVDVSSVAAYTQAVQSNSLVASIPAITGVVSGVPILGAIANFITGAIKTGTQHLGITDAQALAAKLTDPQVALYDKLPADGKAQFNSLVDNFSALSKTYVWAWSPRWKADNQNWGVGRSDRDRFIYIMRTTLFDYLIDADREAIQADWQNLRQWNGEFTRRVSVPLNNYIQTQLGLTLEANQAGILNLNGVLTTPIVSGASKTLASIGSNQWLVLLLILAGLGIAYSRLKT